MLQDIRAWTCVHVPSRTEGLRRYDFERHKQRNYSIKRYGVALMFLRAHGRKSMPVCLEAFLFLCSYFLMFSALAADLITHKQWNTTFSPHGHRFTVLRVSGKSHNSQTMTHHNILISSLFVPLNGAYWKTMSCVIDWVTHWRGQEISHICFI